MVGSERIKKTVTDTDPVNVLDTIIFADQLSTQPETVDTVSTSTLSQPQDEPQDESQGERKEPNTGVITVPNTGEITVPTTTEFFSLEKIRELQQELDTARTKNQFNLMEVIFNPQKAQENFKKEALELAMAIRSKLNEISQKN